MSKTATSKMRLILEKYTGKEAFGEVNHGLPEEFKDWFSDRGREVNSGEYFFDIPKDVHRLKVGNGVDTNDSPLGTE